MAAGLGSGGPVRHVWSWHSEAMPRKVTAEPLTFDLETFLKTTGLTRRIARFAPDAVIFAQGAAAQTVFYIQDGQVKLSVLSPKGKEAVVAVSGPGDFFGEGCLAGQTYRMATARALVASVVLKIPKKEMIRTLHEQPSFSDRFIAHMLVRNIRVGDDLVDQLFNSSEKRLARILLLLARYGSSDATPRDLPKLSQETLAEMVGTTRSRVNFFMNKFRRLGFIAYNGRITINPALLSVVLH